MQAFFVPPGAQCEQDHVVGKEALYSCEIQSCLSTTERTGHQHGPHESQDGGEKEAILEDQQGVSKEYASS